MTDMNEAPRIPEDTDRDTDTGKQSEPIFNLPGSVLFSLALLVVIYVVQEFVLGDDARAEFIVTLSFIPLRYIVPLSQQPDYAALWSPVTYSLLHGGVQHIVFNSLWLMAFGAPVARRIGAVRYVLFWILSAAAAAFFHAGLAWGDQTLLVGASGVVSALMGAACRFAFPGERGYNRTYGHLYPRQSIIGCFRNRTVLIFTGMWLFGNILIALGVNFMGADLGPIAWDAHIGGFLFGLLFFGFFDPIRPDRLPVTQP